MQEDPSIKTVIVENGSGFLRAGFSQSPQPSCVIPCVVSQKYDAVGEQAMHKVDDGIKFPVQYGLIENFEAMQKLWDHCFYDKFQVQPTIHPFLFTQTSLNTKDKREKLTRIMFEEYNVPKLFIEKRASLSLFAIGKTTGLSVQSGFGGSVISPIVDAVVLPHAALTHKVGGKDISQIVREDLSKKSNLFTKSGEGIIKLAIQIKQKYCRFAQNYDQEIKKEGQVSIDLPDGNQITVGNQAINSPEIMFDSKKFGVDSVGLHQCVYDSIVKCGADIQPELFKNIVLSGGNTLFPGISSRLKTQISTLLPAEAEFSIVDKPERGYQTFTGANVFANFLKGQIWISKADYEETGPTIVHRKCQ